MTSAREDILNRLRRAPQDLQGPRSDKPELAEAAWSKEERLKKLKEEMTAQGCEVFHLETRGHVLQQLSEICAREKLSTVVISDDDVVKSFGMAEWGKRQGITLLSAGQYQNRDEFKKALFEEAGAGITGADFAVAESGTLVLAHRESQARLISLAPIIHIAFVPVHRTVAVYEEVIEAIFSDKSQLPSQVSFITGPSMTADIQGAMFRGMHGPKKLFVLLFDEATGNKI